MKDKLSVPGMVFIAVMVWGMEFDWRFFGVDLGSQNCYFSALLCMGVAFTVEVWLAALRERKSRMAREDSLRVG